MFIKSSNAERTHIIFSLKWTNYKRAMHKTVSYKVLNLTIKIQSTVFIAYVKSMILIIAMQHHLPTNIKQMILCLKDYGGFTTEMSHLISIVIKS